MATENSITLKTEEITIHGTSLFTGAVKGTIESYKKWEFDEWNRKITATERGHTITIFLLLNTKEAIEQNFSCVLEINGGYYSPCTVYLYEDDEGAEMHNFV